MGLPAVYVGKILTVQAVIPGNVQVKTEMIYHKKAATPKMVFMGQSSIRKRKYGFWKGIVGYEEAAFGGISDARN